jgi:hypothetical protein
VDQPTTIQGLEEAEELAVLVATVTVVLERIYME